MKINVEPTPEQYTPTINGQKIPTRVWKGVTDQGTEIEAYVLSIVPMHDGDAERMHAEMPPFMKRSRDTFHIEIQEQTDAWDKSMHETGGPPR